MTKNVKILSLANVTNVDYRTIRYCHKKFADHHSMDTCESDNSFFIQEGGYGGSSYKKPSEMIVGYVIEKVLREDYVCMDFTHCTLRCGSNHRCFAN